MNILLVDDDRELLKELNNFLTRLGHIVISSGGYKNALALIKIMKVELIISDIIMPGYSGLELAKKLNKINFKGKIILISGHQDMDKAIASLDFGVYDFMHKPINLNKLVETVNTLNKSIIKTDSIDIYKQIQDNIKDGKNIILNNYKPNPVFCCTKNPYRIMVHSNAIKPALKKMEITADFEYTPVLIQGETGVGKENFSRCYHHLLSKKRKKNIPFVGINCAALQYEMFESELFGYEAHSFTGASSKAREGKIESAAGGVLLLDEISEIPLDVQAKLLRVIQENEYYRVGGTRVKSVNANLIFATNKNLQSLVSKGRFREDLYYRLNSCMINIPPLRERKETIIPFVLHHLHLLNEQYNNQLKEIEAAVLQQFLNYSWPGNFRELKNITTTCFMENHQGKITSEIINSIFSDFGEKKTSIEHSSTTINYDDFDFPDEGINLEEHIKNIVKQALYKCSGNKTKAANLLGLSRTQLYHRYKI